MRRALFHVSIIAVMVLGTILISRPLGTAAQDATPAASPGTGGPPETLVEAMIPAESIPSAPSRLFFLGHVSIAPGGWSISSAEVYECCPGPQFEHVLAGELTLRVEGPLQIVRGSEDGKTGPGEDIDPATEVTLRPGDTAIYQTQLTTEYRNHGTEPVHFLQSALFPEPPPDSPEDSYEGVSFGALEFDYPVPSPPPGPLVATLQQTILAPDELLAAEPSGALRIVIAAPGSPSVKASDGTIQNTSDVPALIYMLTLQAAGAGRSTPTA